MIRSYFKRADPFFDEQENHSLIGVANVFLACLFYDVKLQYAVPIINQKGEVGERWVQRTGLPTLSFLSGTLCYAAGAQGDVGAQSGLLKGVFSSKQTPA